MSRLQQNQNIDSVIQVITTFAQSQCSLSEHDQNVINEALEKLQRLKCKKGKTNEQIRKEVTQIVSLVLSIFWKKFPLS